MTKLSNMINDERRALRAEVARTCPTGHQQHRLIVALSLDPALHHTPELRAYAILEEAEKRQLTVEHVRAALASISGPSPELRQRLAALCAHWPQDRKMPAAEALASIVGGTAVEVELALEEMARE